MGAGLGLVDEVLLILPLRVSTGEPPIRGHQFQTLLLALLPWIYSCT